MIESTIATAQSERHLFVWDRFLILHIQCHFVIQLLLHLRLGILTVRKRVALMVITITAIFGICLVPDIIIHSIDYYTSLSISEPVYVSIHTLVLFNSTVNSFVYALISQTFREKLKGMICCRFTSTKGFWSTISRKSRFFCFCAMTHIYFPDLPRTKSHLQAWFSNSNTSTFSDS